MRPSPLLHPLLPLIHPPPSPPLSQTTAAWSVGLLPLAKDDDKRHTLCSSTAIARAYSSGYGVPMAKMPTGAVITTWVNVPERTWHISSPGEELVTVPIPEEEFPLVIAFNGGSNVTITLVPDAPLPDELQHAIAALGIASDEANSEEADDSAEYQLGIEDLHLQDTSRVFQLLKAAFPESFSDVHLALMTQPSQLGSHIRAANEERVAAGEIDELQQLECTGPWQVSRVQGRKEKRREKLAQNFSLFGRNYADLSCTCWTDASVTLPLHGAFSTCNVIFNYRSSFFSLFFPHDLYGNFDAFDVFPVPQTVNSKHSQDFLVDIAGRIRSPSLKALDFSHLKNGCTAIALLYPLEDAVINADEFNTPLLLHPDSPHSVICTCLNELTRRVAIWTKGLPSEEKLLQSALAPLAHLVRIFCVKTHEVAFVPGVCVQVIGVKCAKLEGASAIICQHLDDNAYICSISDPSKHAISRRFATIERDHLQFSSMSPKVWDALLHFLLECAKKQPTYLIASGIAEILFGDVNLGPCASGIEFSVSKIRSAIARSCCILPPQPNEPVDIVAGRAVNNWPPILDSVVSIMSSCGLHTLKAMFVEILRGQTIFLSKFSGEKEQLTRAKCLLTFDAVCSHFVSYWDNHMYAELVLEVLPNLKLVMNASTFPAAIMFPFIQCLVKLTLCGRFPAPHSSACIHFLSQRLHQDDLKFGVSSQAVNGPSEPQVAALARLFVGFKQLLKAALPYLDTDFNAKAKSSIQFVPVPRFVLRFIQSAWADASVPFVIDSVPIRSCTLLGWCSTKQGPLMPSRIVPITHGVVLASLHRLDAGISIPDISLSTRLDVQLVKPSKNRKPTTTNGKPHITNLKPSTINHKPQTTNHKRQTSHHKSQTKP